MNLVLTTRMNINVFILIVNISQTLSIYFSKNEPKSDIVYLIHSSGTEVLSSCQCHHFQSFDEFGMSDSSLSSNKFENFCHWVACASKHTMAVFLIFIILLFFLIYLIYFFKRTKRRKFFVFFDFSSFFSFRQKSFIGNWMFFEKKI